LTTSGGGRRECASRSGARRWPGRIRRNTAIAVLVIAAAVAGALFAAPSGHPGDSSPEAGFGRDMAVHHAQAVDMAITVRDNTDDPEIRTLALDIALTQQNQIGQLRAWLIHWKVPLTGNRPPMAWMTQPHGHGTTATTASPQPGSVMPGMATPRELQRLRAARGEGAEILFLTLMIRHHRSGIAMAAAILRQTGQPEVRDLARSIANGQQAEINTMQRLLRARGAPPA
jgi:uncharacterized protein (DUF305 family)